NWILFQSLQKRYAYNTKTKEFSIIAPKAFIFKAYKTSDGIFFQTNEGLFEIEKGKSKLFLNDPIVKDNKIINLIESNEGLLFVTQMQGIFSYKNGQLNRYLTNVDNELKQSSIYNSEVLNDGSFTLGTISNGIFILDDRGQLKYKITQKDGLSNNTVLSLFEDVDKNLWIGLDNGINCINLQSPIKSYTDNTGVIGTVYTSAIQNDKLYIGTNQGLFYKSINSNSDFTFIQGTKGQVWSLFLHNGTLFCGHDSGTFVVKNNSASLIYNQSGTWKFESLPNNRNIILQGNYLGISVLEFQNEQWVFKNKIKGFDYSSKYFEIFKNNIYVSHEYKGIYRFDVNKELSLASNLFEYKKPLKGKNASLIKFNNQIYYASREGVFKLNSINKKFEKDSLLSSVFEKDEYVTGKMVVDQSNNLWFFTKNYIHYFSSSKMTQDLKKNSLPIPSSLTNSMPGYENINQISDETFLIGTTDGYYVLKNKEVKFTNYKVSITGVLSNVLNKKAVNYSINEEGSFNYDENNIIFNFTIPEYDKYINAEYQFKLEGIQNEWSEWNSKTNAVFKNLPSGDYVFSVRAKVTNSITKNIASYSFTIKKAWYLSNVALLFYFILFLIIVFYINKVYYNFHEKKHEKIIAENNLLLELKELESAQEIMKIKNEQLSLTVDKKNKELAVSTMNLIKKTELLNIIKEDLKSSTEDSSNRSIKSIISTITRNVKEEDTWNVFKEAFDNADKDFIKKVKELHPSLTPNDLRLCAYLRLNLSSKEIAPLINISVRSVEIKRYRLRKKMDLTHEQGLVEYILSV
ncbi:triple tyrosine motif-containing protein, partial [uncultured Flavobacterium sp.]|uniref:triple tyrosine motif-containing protein n=1 Tax=uncultured Flavobacterium sp. TaxID=165435 RepID=UPI0030EEDA77